MDNFLQSVDIMEREFPELGKKYYKDLKDNAVKVQPSFLLSKDSKVSFFTLFDEMKKNKCETTYEKRQAWLEISMYYMVSSQDKNQQFSFEIEK
jgi:hypothetical protein